MNKLNSLKKIFVLQTDKIGILAQAAIYAAGWFKLYYPLLRLPRFNVAGEYLGQGLKLYFRGHLLVIAVYLILIFFFSKTYRGGAGTGYQKPLSVFFSQFFAILIVNIVSYFQLVLMRGWLVSAVPMLIISSAQLIFVLIWAFISDRIYRAVFPRRNMLLISGRYSTDDIISKFKSRSDIYNIEKCINISEGMELIESEIKNGYGGIVLWDIATETRNDLLKFCYSIGIRVYVMPKISDVLLKGAVQMHLFDTAIFMVQDYSMTVEQRFIKRLIDLVCSIILLVITSPIMIVTAIIIKLYDKGPVFFSQTRCTQHMKKFKVLKFRSMRVDAEKDGIARLATKNDSRITPFGKFIRACRIDELPQLFNILKGEMSFIGPRPERPELIERYMKNMPEFAFRTRVKAGLAGYAQIFGKYNTTPYDKLKLDLTYIENYSIWLDLKLMLLTLKILFTPDSTEGVDEKQISALKNDERG